MATCRHPSAAHHIQAVVIGAGVIGLAVARALAIRGKEVMIIDRASSIGSETSSRNSEVIHAGIYYPTDSHKARFCVQGNRLLYEICVSHSIPFRRCGKLIVAPHENEKARIAVDNYIQSGDGTHRTYGSRNGKRYATGITDAAGTSRHLQALYTLAQSNGVSNVKLLSTEDVRFLEPEVVADGGALYSPSTGVLDSHTLFQALLADAEYYNPATIVLLRTPVERGRVTIGVNTKAVTDTESLHEERQAANPSFTGKLELRVDGIDLQCDTIINCAGLAADAIAAGFHQGTDWKPPRHYYAKGNYFRLQSGLWKKPPFQHLIYPVPDPSGGLGVHATIDWACQSTKFGPDVGWIDPSIALKDIDMNPDTSRSDAFCEQIRKYWPNLPDDSIVPDYAGLRPKLCHPSLVHTSNKVCRTTSFADFYIAGPKDHGIPGLFHLLGIESPGLTSCLSIANYIADHC